MGSWARLVLRSKSVPQPARTSSSDELIMAEKIRWSRALVEGLVIVVSILLALAADAWWEGVQELRLERTYLSQLSASFQVMDTRVTSGWSLRRVNYVVQIAYWS